MDDALKDRLALGLRAQDFHESLKVTGPFGPKDVHYKTTLLVGKAASLAMHLRGLLFIENLQQLEYAASSLGISSLELPAVLKELQEIDFIRIVGSAGKIKRIEIKVPTFRSGYEELGDRWKLLKPSQIEQASICALDRLYKGPMKESGLLRSFGLSPTENSIIQDVMQSGQLMSCQTVDGEPTVFTPLAVDGNPTAYLQWAKKFPRGVQKATEALHSYQGMPLSEKSMAKDPALLDAVATGVIMPVQVSGATGDQQFVFAPVGGLTEDERTILDKARAVIACVRYGERFAKGRPIVYPHLIIDTLRRRKRFKRGHPDLFTQYGLLVEKLIGHPVDEGNGKWNFEVDDTSENMKALQIASDMLQYGVSPSAHISLEAQKALLSPSGYLGPPSTRPRLAKLFQPSSATRAEIIRQMANLARGMGSHG